MATGYSVSQYGSMITCAPRMNAFAEALRRAITPGCRVIDLGAGTGVFSLLACRFGAGEVVAIEPADAVQVLRISARDNGYADRITILQDVSTAFAASHRADVIISDLRGCLPLFEWHIPIIVDARERLLKPGGTLLPMRDTIRIALCNNPEYGAQFEEPWLRNEFGLDLGAGHRFAVNRSVKLTLKPADLLGMPRDLFEIDYRSVTTPDFAAKVELVAERPGTANGLLLWFDTEIAPGLGYSNAPGEPPLVYESSFFPFEQPVTMAPGDRAEIDMRARWTKADYLWTWETRIFRQGCDNPETEYRQNSFLEAALGSARLRAASAPAG